MIDVVRNKRTVQLVLNSPPVNVLDSVLLGELTEQLGHCATQKGLAAVFLRGEGRCFSAGASVEDHKADLAPKMLAVLLDACIALADLPVATVALVHGPCFGGALELISFCDFVVADPTATFGVPEIQLAFFPPFACSRMQRLSGLQNTAYAVLTGDSIDAQRAAAMGLVQKLLDRDEWDQIESQFNGLSLPVLRLAKRALRMGAGGPDRESLERLKTLFLEELYTIEDVKEGIASFEERRQPEWKHR